MLYEFCEHLRRRNLSDRTIATRWYSVRQFEEWLDGDLFDATTDDVRAWLDWKGVGPRARHSLLSSLRQFYRWAVDEGHLLVAPTDRVERPRIPRALPRPAADDDLEVAMRELRPNVRAMVALAAYAGLRCCEIAKLRGEDFRPAEGGAVTLFVHEGKGGADRVVPLHPRALEAVRLHGLPHSGPVFHYRGQPRRALTAGRVSVLGNRALHDVGVASTMHQFRHWFGTALYAATRDLRAVGEVMGHASPVTTQNYVAINVDGIRDRIEAL